MHQPKHLNIALSLILVIAFLSCNKKSDKIEIKGTINGLDNTWMYLSNTYPVGSKPIDSVRAINGTFVFKYHPDTVYEPHLVFLSYKNKINKKRDLAIDDPNKPGHFYLDFLMEYGTTYLTFDLTKEKGVIVNYGPQNKFYFDNIDLPFINVSHDPKRHKDFVNRVIKKIKDMPDAYWAMFALDNFKFAVDNAELKQIYNAFDDETQQSYSGKKIKEFLKNRPDKNAPRPNNLLTDINGKQIKMIDTTKKLNMVIFWASWCGPCRMEIPSLKKIATDIKDSRFRMVSISIDKDTLSWKKALNAEQMQWQQLVMNPALLDKLTAQYNLDAIPQIYFIDGKRNLVAHMTGFAPNNESLFKKTIIDFLKK
ncbi:MAG: Thiol-disulfide isomerase or thioredoxin [Mucilaginibacter sp.]|nr:Thiol-disulfide isomerase or thioredoxin [Mucilaginibacter sp.]